MQLFSRDPGNVLNIKLPVYKYISESTYLLQNIFILNSNIRKRFNHFIIWRVYRQEKRLSELLLKCFSYQPHSINNDTGIEPKSSLLRICENVYNLWLRLCSIVSDIQCYLFKLFLRFVIMTI